MASMADYMVLADATFKLSDQPLGPGDVERFTFTLPADFTVGTHYGKPILSLIVIPRSPFVRIGAWVNPEGPNFQLLESTQEMAREWTKPIQMEHSLWEAISGTRFKAGKTNDIFIKAWNGSMEIRGVVLWFQRGSGS